MSTPPTLRPLVTAALCLLAAPPDSAWAAGETTRVDHLGLELTLPGGWRSNFTDETHDGWRQGMSALASDAWPDCGLLVVGPLPRASRGPTLADTLEGVAKQVEAKHTLIEAQPTAPVHHVLQTGVDLAIQLRVSDGPDGLQYAGYYAIEIDGSVWLFLAMTSDRDRFGTLTEALLPSVAAAKASSAPRRSSAAVATPQPAPEQPPSAVVTAAGVDSEVGDAKFGGHQSALGHTGVAVAKDSKKLPQVPYEVSFVATETGSIERSGLCRNRFGEVFGVERRQVVQYKNGSRTYTAFDKQRLQADLRRVTGDQGLNLMKRTGPEWIDCDRDGNLFVAVRAYKAGAVIVYPRASSGSAVELVVSPHRVAPEGRFQFHAVPSGGAGWLLTEGQNGKVLPTRTVRGADGTWRLTAVRPRVAKGVKDQPDFPWAQAVAARPDFAGGLVWRAEDTIWRIRSDGIVYPLAKVPGLSTKDSWRSNLIVLANGDIWIALNQVLKGGSTTVGSQTNTWAIAGKRSRWLRIRLRDGGAEAMEIDGKALLERLGKPGVFSTKHLAPDHATGGLVAWDSHRAGWFGVVPKD